jgi:2-polyprenyl-6-methoxyphenol hydroxylase-like FAD-dependent oxidoreductase
MTDVVVVGAGPTGLMLACELRLAGARPVVLERLPEPSPLPRANGVVGQVVRLLDLRGLLERFAADAFAAGPLPVFQFGPVPMSLGRLADNPLRGVVISQPQVERLLRERAHELGVDIRSGHELTALSQEPDDGVLLGVRGPGGEYRLHTRYVVGCDGARSFVRKATGVGFPGTTSDQTTRMGDVTLPETMIVPETGELDLPGVGRLRPAGWTRTERGSFVFGQFRPGTYRVAVIEDGGEGGLPADRDEPMTLEELRGSARRVLGADLPMTDPLWLSRTVGNSRQAERYRTGRVLLAGDAAHLFSAGGAALNTGLTDAANLAWKLAAQVNGWAPPGLLDTYHDERHPAGRRALMHTRAQAALLGQSVESEALREVFTELFEHDEPLRQIGEMLNGSDIRYDMALDTDAPGASPHALVGGWVPDLMVTTGSGATRVARLMRGARPVLLDLTGGRSLAEVAEGWKDRVDVVTARGDGHPAPADALLIRPDCYVAWATGPATGPDDAAAGLRGALTRWFGSALLPAG